MFCTVFFFDVELNGGISFLINVKIMVRLKFDLFF